MNEGTSEICSLRLSFSSSFFLFLSSSLSSSLPGRRLGRQSRAGHHGARPRHGSWPLDPASRGPRQSAAPAVLRTLRQKREKKIKKLSRGPGKNNFLKESFSRSSSRPVRCPTTAAAGNFCHAVQPCGCSLLCERLWQRSS